jgi:murein L,D-transpeptidase YafK
MLFVRQGLTIWQARASWTPEPGLEASLYADLKISYPDAAHRARARSLGVSPGGDIMIHGLPARQAWVGAAHRDFDWTEGCIAVTNKEIDEIWTVVRVGTPILVKP